MRPVKRVRSREWTIRDAKVGLYFCCCLQNGRGWRGNNFLEFQELGGLFACVLTKGF